MKKLILIILTVSLTLCNLFAVATDWSVGFVGQTNKSVTEVMENYQDISFDDFDIGLTTDFKIFVADIDASIYPTRVNNENFLRGFISANVCVDFPLIRASLGMGYNYTFNTTQGFILEGVNIKNPKSDVLTAEINLRGEVDLVIKDTKIGIYGLLPTSAGFMTIKDFDFVNNWKNTTLGIIIKTSVF